MMKQIFEMSTYDYGAKVGKNNNYIIQLNHVFTAILSCLVNELTEHVQ